MARGLHLGGELSPVFWDTRCHWRSGWACHAGAVPRRGYEYLYSVASTASAAFGSILMPGPIVALTTMRLM